MFSQSATLRCAIELLPRFRFRRRLPGLCFAASRRPLLFRRSPLRSRNLCCVAFGLSRRAFAPPGLRDRHAAGGVLYELARAQDEPFVEGLADDLKPER